MISESELARFVADEHRLIVELLARGILRPSWTCAHGRDHYPSVTSRQFRCRCIREDSRKTIFYCSFFENTSLPIATVFRLAYDWIADLPVRACSDRRSVSQNTICVYYRYFRQLTASSLATAPVRVGGVGVCVEVDEMFVSRDSETGDEVWVIGALERTPEKRLHLSILHSKTPEAIVDSLSGAILPGSLLVTDFLPSYSLVAQSLSLPHTRVNKSRSFVDQSTRMHTNHIEATWMHLHRFLAKRSRVALADSLAEFVWRRLNAGRLWQGFLDTLASVDWS
jgi:ligand-binding SRPBCC domain-containing protein